jgi:DNA-directed RNA polymerase specialized sigma subunit
MLDYNQIKDASAKELQCQMKLLKRDIQHAESWLQDLDQAENVLKKALYSLEDEGKPETALKKQLQKCGLTQKALARRLGISEAAVSLQVRTGIKMAKVATKYARAMHCDPRSLLEF